MNITFDPVIAEQDKNEESLSLAVIITYNPHFRVNPDYPSSEGAHSTKSVSNFLCNIRTPIENYSTAKMGTGFREILITDNIKNQYSNIYGSSSFDLTSSTIFDDLTTNGICLTSEEKVEIGALMTTKVGGKYRVYFLVNGRPSKLSDGTDYIEVDTKTGYLYCLDHVEIAGADAYDTINPYPIKCASEFEDLEITRAVFPFVIMPHEE